jgi:glutamate synthase (NADPH/NADH) small chain
MILRTSSSHEEGCERHWAVLTKAFLGDEHGFLRAVEVVDVRWDTDPTTGKSGFREVEGSLREIPCQLAFLAMGFLHPQREGMLEQLGLALDERNNVQTSARYQTSVEKVFAAGDMRRGQSLVVWAISEGREAARAVDEYLMGQSSLEAKSGSPLILPVADK